MLENILLSHAFQAFWLFLPAGVANMTPPIANKIPVLNRWKTPLDLGKSYKGKRIFGDNKTWRGVAYGIITAGIVRSLQLYPTFAGHLSTTTIVLNVLFGMLMGAGALFGDAIESFFKRRIGVGSGKSWFPFDQTDYIIGALIITYPLLQLPLYLILWVFGIYFGLHLVVSYIAFLLGFKDKPI